MELLNKSTVWREGFIYCLQQKGCDFEETVSYVDYTDRGEFIRGWLYAKAFYDTHKDELNNG